MRTFVLIASFAVFAASAFAQSNTACGNGDFESGIDPSEWSGGHGVVLRNGDPHFGSFTAGLIPGMSGGLLNAASSHQTWVDATELDPIVGISRVAPGGSTHAVRIGNSVCNARADMLTKTFVVGAAQSVIRFSYAVVLQGGAGHSDAEEASFSVRVLDVSRASAVPILNAARLVGGTDKLVAGDSSLVQKPGTDVFYRNWTRASIDLSRYVGRTVTVQFLTEDCSGGGHYAYAYVDDFCSTSCGAALDLVLPPKSCEVGEVCVHYTLPDVAGETGRVVIDLDVIQDGTVVDTLSSPTLTGGSSYCFSINPDVRPFSTLEGGLDFAATGRFTSGSTTCAVLDVGSPTEGILPGRDNDYHLDCGTPGCCTGFNAIVNGDFEAGSSGFGSDYTRAVVPGPVHPGQYAVLNAAEAAAVASTWTTASDLGCDVKDKMLVVNGDTGEDGSRMVWSQTVPVIEGQNYRFCANFRNFPICGFDVVPQVELRFTAPTDGPAPTVIDTRRTISCDWKLESQVHIPDDVTTLTCEIWLNEGADGDGNDLAIDDISLFLTSSCSVPVSR